MIPNHYFPIGHWNMIGFDINLSALRKKRNLTQQNLADFLGVQPRLVGRWEQGQGKPGPGGWRDRRQGASGGSAQTHSSPDRWGAAIHRRAHQDGPGNGDPGRARRSLRVDRPLAGHDHPGFAS